MNPMASLARWFDFSGIRHHVYYRHIYARPRWGFRNKVTKSVSRSDFQELALRLDAQGVVILPSYFSTESLREMQADFERSASTIAPDEVAQQFLDRSYLSASAPLCEASIDPFLTALVKYHFGKPIYLSDNNGLRIEPVAELEDYDTHQWHHDAKRKQVKVLILLTDVQEDGQRMDYLPGTHKIWHGRVWTNKDSEFTSESVRKYGEPVHCAGPAGTVVIFDTNGLHRGNRNLGARRDVWFFHYSAGRQLAPRADLHPDVVRTMTAETRRMARVDHTA